MRRQVDNLNRERKLQQHAAGAELGALQAEYLELVHKNAEIDAACRGLEAEVAAMRGALPRAEAAPDGDAAQGSGGQAAPGEAAAGAGEQQQNGTGASEAMES